MAQQTNKNTRIKDFIETPIDDSAALKLYSVPADTKMPSQFPGETCDNRVEAFEPSYSDREDGILGTYLHQIGKIPRLAPEEELRLFIKIGKYRKQTDECYRELATYFPDIDLDNPPSPAMLSQKII
ncbi:MAG: hypothetical protein O7E52_11240, partial [Candidatus Poribacteria bacterium]|nr:hypothetical protein [Candidatus Poribacteria bacterium]